jgi:phosphatidylglycerophosphate synthase
MDEKEVQKIISSDRSRTNLLKNIEKKTLAHLVQIIPAWISSDMLTFIGFLGSITIFAGFVLGATLNRNYILIGIAGFAINWFGDSLDGRIAFYRNKIRKWYGLTLDLTTDWINTIIIGLGFMIYAEGSWEFIGFGFVVLYGWAMINTLIRYKITGEYVIDSGIAGPTEVRIIVSIILIAEVFLKGSINYFAVFICVLLFFVNIFQMFSLLKQANKKDVSEKLIEKELAKPGRT